MFQVKGDNYRRSKNADEYDFEIGCDLFVKNPKSESYKKMDKWWLIDSNDVLEKLKEPVVVKVTSKRSNFLFDSAKLG